MIKKTDQSDQMRGQYVKHARAANLATRGLRWLRTALGISLHGALRFPGGLGGLFGEAGVSFANLAKLIPPSPCATVGRLGVQRLTRMTTV